MNQTTTQFSNYNCIKLENDALALWITQDVGPRIIGLSLHGGPNLLAQLPQTTAVTPQNHTYQ